MSSADEDPPADDAVLERLLRDRRFGPPGPGEATPWDFVQRWPQRVLHDRVWPIVSRLLLDKDALVRARAVEFVRLWRDGAALTTPTLMTTAEQHASEFGDQRPEGLPLREMLAHALADRAAGSGEGRRIAGILKSLAAQEPVGGGAAAVLGEYEPGFVTVQAKRWGDGAIDEAARSLALFQRDAILPFLTAARSLGEANRERLAAVVEAYVRRDDSQATTMARAEELPPPQNPAPSPAECRRALGLG
jgi:hypothetical protein